MARIVGSPSRYIQGKGTLKELNKYTEKLGKKLLVIVSASGKKRVSAAVEASIAGTDTSVTWEIFNGECSRTEINRILKTYQEIGGEVVVGIGGGKILDTAKAVAFYAKTPVVIVPTAAAPCPWFIPTKVSLKNTSGCLPIPISF